MKGRIWQAILCVLLFLAYRAAWPVSPSVPVGSALPEQVSKAIAKEQQDVTARPTLPPVITEKEEQPPQIAEQAKKIKFKLNKIILVGNHVYTEQQLLPLYQDKLNKTIPVSDLFAIVQRITNFYRNNGYIISRAILPPQHVKEGVVKIQVIEGFIDEVTVGGEPRGAERLVWMYGKKISKTRPLQIKVMEFYLLLANEIPATEVKAVLSPSKKTVGAADLTLVTRNRPITGYLSYDNYGTRYIGPQQMTANLNLNSMIISGDTTRMTYTKTPKGKELVYTDLAYNTPIGYQGMRWIIGGTQAATRPLFVLRPTQIEGQNDNYYTLIQYPLIRSRTQNLTIHGGFNYLDSNVTSFGSEVYTDHLRPIGLGAVYNFADRFYGANIISADVRRGLPVLGYTSNTSPTALISRLGGEAKFTKVDLQLSRLQAVYGAFSLYGLLQGQYAFNPLLAAEQFTFGGPQLGRGYDVAELIGDRGAAGSLEARLDAYPQRFYVRYLQFYAFYDIGAIWNIKFVAGQPKKVSATSTGVGTRFFLTKYVSGNVMWAQPLSKQIAAEQLINDGWRPRVFFSLVASLD